MKKRICTIDNQADLEILRSRSLEVDEITEEIEQIITDLLDTMRGGDTPDRVGVGLAAPQIGHSLRVLVLEYDGETAKHGKTYNKIPTTILINPVIDKTSQEKETMDEGCFSVPVVYGPVSRPKKIRLTALNEKGKKIKLNATGYFARVLQHEIDHLDGILYTDHVEKGKLFKYVKTDDGEWSVEY